MISLPRQHCIYTTATVYIMLCLVNDVHRLSSFAYTLERLEIIFEIIEALNR